jgi:hypothetical protein
MNANTIKAEKLFEDRFKMHMKGGSIQEFKKDYRTMYNKIIIPMMVEMLESENKTQPRQLIATANNGKQIHEGDILRFKLEDKCEPNGFHVVDSIVKEHIERDFVVDDIDFDYSTTPFEDRTKVSEILDDKFEIVGNIHDKNVNQ